MVRRQGTVEDVELNSVSQVDAAFWKGKRVFLTGHTGFKGSWLSLWLQQMGVVLQGYALTPPTEPSLFDEARVAEGMGHTVGDVRDLESLHAAMAAFRPEIVIHMAAQPLVRLSYAQPVDADPSIVMGSVPLLDAVSQWTGVRVVDIVTTDKCYENKEWVWGYREDEPMGGYDPYSNSKGCSELVTSAYRRSFFQADGPALASARAGNVIGGGDWALDRLLPDILRAFEAGKPVIVRNPQATRPWQHVLEPLSGYLVLAQALWNQGLDMAEGWNFGPEEQDARPVSWICDHMVDAWGEGAAWQLDQALNPHEASYLKLDISKAKVRLGWTPTWALATALDKIVTWHQGWLAGADSRDMCMDQIEQFSKDCGKKT